MSTAVIMKKLNRDLETLRRDVAEIKTVLLKTLAIPEESLKGYKNAAHIKKALAEALKVHPLG